MNTFSSQLCPKNFFVISAKDEDLNMVFLRDLNTVFDEFWSAQINDQTRKFETKSEAVQIMDIQKEMFREQNGTLCSFKVKEIKYVPVIL